MPIQAQWERNGIAPIHSQMAQKGTDQDSATAALPPGKIQYPLYRRLREFEVLIPSRLSMPPSITLADFEEIPS